MTHPTPGTPLHVSALGVTIAIHVGHEGLRALAATAWSGCAASAPHDGEGARQVSAPVVAADAGPAELARALQDLTQLVTREAIAARAGRLLMFHAGALCDQTTGATIAMVAPGGTGKTTVVRALGRGRGYVSDETVAVDDHHRVVPYCKPLSVRRPERPDVKDELAPAQLSLAAPAVQPWLAGLVVLRRDLPAGAGVLVEPVDALDALVLLAPETSSLARLDRPLQRLARLIESVGGLRRVRFHDAVDLEPLVADVLARRR
ncbi:hypothetical protein [Terrabacter sp. NPDC080008]|uniref:hypothetical protein n=1 Tax=Terrabacter sp. NPDC080008 TaxID=3155176 RepID=UPI00344FBA5D